MEKLSYKQAFDLITEAYIKGEIKPGDMDFCFCGTLCHNSSKWYGNKTMGFHFDYAGYTGEDFVKMENALCSIVFYENDGDPAYEEKLFAGMCAALEVLKEIHKNRGENVEEFEFVKRCSLT